MIVSPVCALVRNRPPTYCIFFFKSHAPLEYRVKNCCVTPSYAPEGTRYIIVLPVCALASDHPPDDRNLFSSLCTHRRPGKITAAPLLRTYRKGLETLWCALRAAMPHRGIAFSFSSPFRYIRGSGAAGIFSGLRWGVGLENENAMPRWGVAACRAHHSVTSP